MNMKLELLKVSETDLEAAEYLYKKKLYSQSIFYFQQSVEKASKSLGLHLEIITEKDLLRIRHEPVRIYEKFYQNTQKNYLIFENLLGKSSSSKREAAKKSFGFPKLNRQMTSLLNKLKGYRKEWQGLISLPYYEILETFDEVDEELDRIRGRQLRNTEFAKFRKIMLTWFDVLHQFNPKKVEEERAKLEQFSDKQFLRTLEKLKPRIIEFFNVYLTLFFLGLMTMPHSSVSRYPNSELDISPIKIYNKRLPIVKLLPKLFPRHSNALIDYKKLLRYAKRTTNKGEKT